MQRYKPPAIDGLWQLDLANPLSIAHFIKKVKAELGTLDLLVMNAGRYIFGRMRNISLHKSRLLYQTNVWGHHQLFQELSPLFPAEGYARVMLTSSSSDPGYMGYYGDPTTGVGMWSSATQPYTASKAALARLGANIWADQQQNATIGDQSNICVTVLYPPSVNTRLNDNAIIADDPNHPLVSSAIETNTTFLTYLGLNPLLAGEAYGQMAEMAEPFLDAYIYDVTLDPENDPRDIPQFFMQQILIDLNVQQRKRTFRSLE